MRERQARHRPGRDRDAGIVSLEVAILFPACFLLILATVQVSLWFFARAAALAAARAGAVSGASYNSSPANGAAAAQAFAAAQAGDMLSGVHASTDGSTGAAVRITVSGTSLSLIPGWTITVSQTSQEPSEVFTP